MTKLLLVSIHKSGTNMLTQAIGGNHQQIDGKMERGNIHPHPNVVANLKEFQRFGRSHLPYHKWYGEIMKEQKGKILFLYRDIRDCIVSWTYYVDKIKGTEWFTNFEVSKDKRLEDFPFSERMTQIICESRFIYKRFVDWMDAPDDLVYKMKYEDILTSKKETFQDFINWMGTDLIQMLNTEFDCSRPEYMMKRIDPANCNTYRKGAIGQWKHYFTYEQKKLFHQNLQDLLEKLGYD